MPRTSIDQKVLLRHYFKEGQTAVSTYESLSKQYHEEAPCLETVKRWFRKFRSGNEDLEDGRSTGRPIEIDRSNLKISIENDSTLTCKKAARVFNCSPQTICNNLHAIGKTFKKGIWVPHNLTKMNKDERVKACNALINRNKKEPFVHRLITSDEKWITFSNQRMHGAWVNQNESGPRVPKRSLTKNKVMLSVWWDSKGIIWWELLKSGETVDSQVYIDQLYTVQEELKILRPALVNRQGVIFLQDNASSHTSKVTKNFLKELGWDLIKHPPYSPDLAPSDYHLFRSLEHFLKDKNYNSKEEVENDLEVFFREKTPEFYARAFQILPERWAKIVDSNGEYIV